MFDAVRNNRRLVQIFLALITIPFALWGVESYIRNANDVGTSVAQVGKVEISEAELNDAVSRQVETLREQMGPAAAELANSQAFRESVLDRLINEKAIAQRTAEANLRVPDFFLRDLIANHPEFQENGAFSKAKYDQVLASQGLSGPVYEDRVRRQLEQQLFLAPLVQSAHAPASVMARWVALQEETRDIAELKIDSKAFESKVKLAADAARKYYDANVGRYEVPEQARVEFVVLAAEDFAKKVKVTEADAKKFYDDNIGRFGQPEERRASHILVKAEASDKKEARDAARKKAEGILAKVRAQPKDFAALAKSNSEDSSAESGGDLGFFSRNDMVKPFADAVWGMKPGDISGIVETDFGFHIIQLNEVRGGASKPFEAAKAEIIDDLTRQQANKQFLEAADQFSNLVYEQSDSLTPAASKFGLGVQKSEWLPRKGAVPGILGNAKLQSAIFSDEVLKNRRNTEAVDVGNNMLVSARVVEHKPAAVRAFEEVRKEIEAQLITDEAAKLAKADGEAKLAQLNKGEKVAATWPAARPIKRDSGLSPEAQKAIFGAKTDKLPAYVGVADPASGYALYRIDKVTKPVVAANDPRIAGSTMAYSRIVGDVDSRAYLTAVREKLGVTTKPLTVQPASE